MLNSTRFIVSGHVQGVGFRPFVYRVARALDLTGYVLNRGGQVEIVAQGPAAARAALGDAVLRQHPPLARPRIDLTEDCAQPEFDAFSIRPSAAADQPDIQVPPDYFACADCLAEIDDPGARRYRYPFINCTQCGPRYTLIDALPYDRPNTSMAAFALCPACAEEYSDPLDRRFHAEPLACATCGPSLSYRQDGATVAGNEAALAGTLAALRAGAIVAVKGVGGYHLMCDARNATAVAGLRARKHRPHKPLAVMYPLRGEDGLAAVREDLDLTPAHADALRSPQRPIVLAPMRHDATLAPEIAPGLGEVGAFLPYSPLHHLLLKDFGGPLVATSGNVSGEPVIIDNDEAEQRLSAVADAFLHHDRPIVRPADDSVLRVIAAATRPLRVGRGLAPLELRLPWPIAYPTLAVGGHLKNTVALAWGERVVISPHIGELDSPRSLAVFEQVLADLQRLYQVRAERIAHDVHPRYASTRWAKRQPLPARAVLHHPAHASALAGEYPEIERWLTFTWDGTGYGSRGSLWGGEAFFGCPGRWQRVASFRPFRLPGGDKAGREPWRSAAALCWELGRNYQPQGVLHAALAHSAWTRGINTPVSSAVGRLFDAASCLLGLGESVSHEGQGPMRLEALAGDGSATVAPLPLGLDNAGVLRADWAPLPDLLTDPFEDNATRARNFHATLAVTLVAQALWARERFGAFTVGLTGGVFQNRILTELALAHLAEHGFDARLTQQVPCNDGGLAYGQIIEVLHVDAH
ncbi:MAG: carbamoyltransferase HypF [Thiotrichales bacterium]